MWQKHMTAITNKKYVMESSLQGQMDVNYVKY